MLNEQQIQNGDSALLDLRNYIAQSGLKVGQRLPSERKLTTTLGVTRTALRKALDALEREGTIWRHVGKGTFVAATSNDLEEMAKLPPELGRQLTPFKMMRARLAIEPSIAREAAMNASAEHLAKLHSAMERTRNAASWEDYEGNDDEFHRAVAEASDNLLLLTIFDQLNIVRRAVAWGNVTRTTNKPPRNHSSFSEHELITKSIGDRDPAAAYEAMRTHLKGVSARLFEEA
ncbi:MAG: FadR/GntR family transcriptional regulator [Rhizobiaceae bacterium]